MYFHWTSIRRFASNYMYFNRKWTWIIRIQNWYQQILFSIHYKKIRWKHIFVSLNLTNIDGYEMVLVKLVTYFYLCFALRIIWLKCDGNRTCNVFPEPKIIIYEKKNSGKSSTMNLGGLNLKYRLRFPKRLPRIFPLTNDCVYVNISTSCSMWIWFGRQQLIIASKLYKIDLQFNFHFI